MLKVKEKLKPFKKIYLEISNICNLKCSFCTVVEREKSVLKEDHFTKYLDQIKPLAERVCLHVMGEPLGHKEFKAFVEIAKEKEINLEITTKGTLLSETNVFGLLSSNVVQVNFSIQSFFDNFPKADPRVYIQKIFDFSKKALIERPDLYINYRLWNIGADGMQDKISRNFISALENSFDVKVNQKVEVGFKKSKNILGRLYLHFDSRFEWPDLKSEKINLKGRCYGTLSHIAISANGNVLPCCLDKEEEIILGSLNDNTLEQVLSSERFLNMKKGFESGLLVEDLCKRCTYIQRF